MRARQLVHERDAEMEVRDGAAPGVEGGGGYQRESGKGDGPRLRGDSKCGVYDLRSTEIYVSLYTFENLVINS